MAKVALPLLFAAVSIFGGSRGPLAAPQDRTIIDFSQTEIDTDREIGGKLSFSSPLEAYRQGKTAYDEGWYGLALPALRFAARRGVFGARLKLAKMYELGLGVSRSRAEAFDIYSNISKKHWNISNFHPAAPYIGQALTSLGSYYLDGIEEIGLKPDIRRAATHFAHAAQYFGNPRAQYELAKLYLSGQGVKKNVRRAVAWLNNATKKKHAPSQALLGQMLWEGALVPKRQIKALALLTMAQENAGPQDSEWISELYKTIVAQSDINTRRKAKTAVANWVRIYHPRGKNERITIRKQLRIGIAEDGSHIIEGRQSIRRERVREAAPRQAYKSRKRVVRRKFDNRGMSPEERQWMGLGSFKEIDAK